MAWPRSGPRSSAPPLTSSAAPMPAWSPPRRSRTSWPRGSLGCMKNGYRFQGCMPANLLPFTADLAIDEPAYRKHLRWLADAKGVTGIVANGHAAEVSSLTREERKRALGIALDEVAGKLPAVAAVKDWSNDIVAYERNLRALRDSGRPVAMLSSFTLSLMASFLLGADGCISGMGSVAADLQAALFAAVQSGDLATAQRINERLTPLVNVFYAPPFVDMHNRMKEALVLLGRIPAAHVRPPLTPVSSTERQAIRAALVAAALQ